MKIIQALKKIKNLNRKADDIKHLVGEYCADLDCETPFYTDQRQEVQDWLQAHNDIVKEILRLRFCIQKTNILTQVTIDIDGEFITRSIAEWIHRRKDLAKMQESVYRALTEKNLKELYTQKLTNNTVERVVHRRLYFDPKNRDKKIEIFKSEPSAIDGTLEWINSVTDLVE